ncbi:unnamed protein product [Clavelina lepadiformis]|uniref:Uncharacterized protein n=1 Tax=Clavelina lepadiformis TaxID=159417 RepID=A0ABP0GU07_CLALP
MRPRIVFTQILLLKQPKRFVLIYVSFMQRSKSYAFEAREGHERTTTHIQASFGKLNQVQTSKKSFILHNLSYAAFCKITVFPNSFYKFMYYAKKNLTWSEFEIDHGMLKLK